MASPSNLKSTPLTPTNLKNTTLSETAQAFLLALTTEFKSITWRLGSRFKYRPAPISAHSCANTSPSGTIFIDQSSSTPMPYFALLTLHELGHALSNHQSYRTDIERLRIEAEAWQRAKFELSRHQTWQRDFNLTYDEEFAENELDSYRDWLHQKSCCKKCGLTRFQTPDGRYHCPNCDLL